MAWIEVISAYHWRCDVCGEISPIIVGYDWPDGWVHVFFFGQVQDWHFCSKQCEDKYLQSLGIHSWLSMSQGPPSSLTPSTRRRGASDG